MTNDPDAPTEEERAELYELYRMARLSNGCRCIVCVRLRQKRWDDQNNLMPGVREAGL